MPIWFSLLLFTQVLPTGSSTLVQINCLSKDTDPQVCTATVAVDLGASRGDLSERLKDPCNLSAFISAIIIFKTITDLLGSKIDDLTFTSTPRLAI